MRADSLRLIATSLAGLGVISATLAGPAASPAVARVEAKPTASELREDLAKAFAETIAGSSARHVAWEADVQGLGIIQHGALSTSKPASNEKLFTAETALQLLGPAYRFTTTLGTTGRVVDGVLHGSLVVVGSGNPVLATNKLRDLAVAVRAAGIRRITGHLIVNDTKFQTRDSAPGWKGYFTPDYLGPIDAFAVDENSWNDTAAYLRQPGVGNGGLLLQALKKAKVKLKKGKARLGAPSKVRVVASTTSEPLAKMVSEMLTQSDDFVAEMLLDDIGEAGGQQGSLSTGVAAIADEARKLNVQLGTLVDGSGLSYDDRESPADIVDWLEATAASSTYSQLYAGLPIACETGTLQDRFCGPKVRGLVHAKTGTLTGVRALSGYTQTESGRAVTFSVLISGARNMSTAGKHLDDAVATLVKFDR